MVSPPGAGTRGRLSRRGAPNACTSLLVGRRDPSVAGLRGGGAACGGGVCASSSQTRQSMSGSADGSTGVTRGRDTLVDRVRSVAIADGVNPVRRTLRRLRARPAVGGAAQDSTRSSVCDAQVLGTFRTRLVTRTKESSMCASHRDSLLNL